MRVTRAGCCVASVLAFAACGAPPRAPALAPWPADATEGEVTTAPPSEPETAGTEAETWDDFLLRPGEPPVEPTRVHADGCLFTDLDYMRAPLFRVRERVLLASALPGVTPSIHASSSPGEIDAGTLVLGSRELDGFRCVYAADPSGIARSGFVRSELVERVADPPAPPAAELVGDWRAAGEEAPVPRQTAHFRIEHTPEGLVLRGEAFWGGSDGYDIHFGSYDGPINYADGLGQGTADCRIWLMPRGPFVMVGDDRDCGGANVAFTDIYVRSPRPIEFEDREDGRRERACPRAVRVCGGP